MELIQPDQARSSSTGIFVSVINTTAAKPVTIHARSPSQRHRPAGTIGRNASASVIVCGSDCAGHWWTMVFGIQIGNECQFPIDQHHVCDEATGGSFAEKQRDTINVGQAYLGLQGFKDVTLGPSAELPNPLASQR